MAQHMIDIFGDLLHAEDVDESKTALPSPEELKHKILIKVRRGREGRKGGRKGGRERGGRKGRKKGGRQREGGRETEGGREGGNLL